MTRVAVDVGYGYTKAVMPGKQVCFASAVAPAPADDLRGALGRAVEMPLVIDGERRVVGEAALAVGGQRPWATDAAARADYVRLVAASLVRLGVPAGDVQLYVGVPLGYYREQREPLRALLEGRTIRAGQDGGAIAQYRIVSVRVLPQGLGAYATAVHDHPDLRRQPVGVVDIGYRTTDFVIVRHGPAGAEPVKYGSTDIGVQAVADYCRARLREQGVPADVGRVEQTLEAPEPVIVYRGRRYELPVAEAEKAVADRIAEAVQHAWADDLDYLHAVLLTGGGGRKLHAHFSWPHKRVPADPLYANARGYLFL